MSRSLCFSRSTLSGHSPAHRVLPTQCPGRPEAVAQELAPPHFTHRALGLVDLQRQPRIAASHYLQHPLARPLALDVGRGTVDDESVMSPRQHQVAQDDKGAAARTERDVRISHSGRSAFGGRLRPISSYHECVTSIRQQALQLALCRSPDQKAAGVRSLDANPSIDTTSAFTEPVGIPGRPDLPALVPHSQLRQRSMRTAEGRAALIHALAHIELNAIDLALDIVWRFAGMPDLFYQQWLGVAKEEALHFQLLRDHLQSLGYEYGAFPAHNALWEMAEKTKNDLLARLALVPRTLEARGLDASPPIKAKLVGAGDVRAGAILDIILRDEIGHVAVGNHWFRMLCSQRGLDPVATYAELAEQHHAPRPRGPFNLDARRAAGFDEAEIAALIAN